MVESPPKRVEIGLVGENRVEVISVHERCSYFSGVRCFGSEVGGSGCPGGRSEGAGPRDGVCGFGESAAVEHLPDAGGWPGDVCQRGGGGGEAGL